YVEFVEFEPEFVLKQVTTGACCQMQAGGLCIEDVTATQCTGLPGGVFLGVGTTCGGPSCGVCCQTNDACVVVSPDFCADIPAPNGPGVFVEGELDCATFDCAELDDPDCGVAGTGSCFDPENGTPFCDDENCCEDVGDMDPFCIDDTEELIWPGRGGTGVGHWDAWCADHALELCAGVFGGGSLPPAPAYDPDAATPSFTDAQGYQTPQGWGFPVPANIGRALRYTADGTPNLLDGYSGEGFDLQAVWDVGEILIDSGLAPENLTRGKTIKVGVIEHAAFVAGALGLESPYLHEDLDGKVITETEQEFNWLIIDGSADSTGHHGTATLGIIGAIDHDAAGNPVSGLSPTESLAEEVGMVGMAPDADLYFFSNATVGGHGTQDAIVRALDAGFGPGDVLSFSIGPGGCGTLNNSPSAATLMSVATATGVTCCIAAGNDCCNLDTTTGGIDSGAIVVGAVFPGVASQGEFNTYCRLPFSNYCQGCTDLTGTAVHLSAWGTAVATLGGGDLYTGTSTNAFNRTYQNDFGGTSAAAPQIASAIACLQGLSKMMWGIPLSPGLMRGLVSGHGYRQCGFSAGNMPGSTAIPFNDCTEGGWIYSNGDWNISETGNFVSRPASTVAFTDLFRVAEEVVVAQFWDGNPLVDGIQVLEGTLISGNAFSIKSADDMYLVVSSALTTPNGINVSERGDIISGNVTDVLIQAHVVFGGANSMNIGIQSRVSAGAGLVLLYLYSFDFGFWMVGGVGFVGGADTNLTFPVGNAGQFIRDSDKQVRFRIQTVSGAFGPTYEVYHDFIGLTAGGNPQVPSDGP
ncbi:MAG: S8 family serine peptidase, partial [Planctomycetota bacterium]